LPGIAASSEFHYAETSFDLRTLGMSGPKITQAVPNASGYNIEAHVALLKAIDAIRDAAHDPSTVVTPRPIKVDVRDDSVYVQALVRTAALRNVTSGNSCRDAKKSLANNHAPTAENVVESVYVEMTGKCDGNPVQSGVVLATVRQMFSDAGVRP
jgi:hypothetical protein